MNKKLKKDLSEVVKSIDELMTFKSYKAISVALQKQVKELQETNVKLAKSNEDLSTMVEHLKDQVDSLESSHEDALDDEYQRGYDEGHAESEGDYDAGHSDGFAEGREDAMNEIREKK